MTDEVPRRARLLSRAIPERRVYVRTDARTRYFSLCAVSQLGLSVVAASFIGWSVYATAAMFDRAMDGSDAKAQIAAVTEAYEARIQALYLEQDSLETALAMAESRAGAITGRLAEKQAVLFDTEEALRDSSAELDALRTNLSAAEAEAETQARRTALAEAEVARLELALAGREADTAGLGTTLETVTAAFADVVADRDKARSEAGTLSVRVAALEVDIARWETRQERMLTQLEDAARISLAGLDRVFERSDVDLDAILDGTRADYSGSGGPFEPFEESKAAPDDTADVRIAALMSDLERVNLMRIATERLPFGMPVRSAVRLTSPFGPRRDPYRRGVGMHLGMDMAAPVGTPIFATAEGVVTFAGRQRGYGIVVKIRHAFGFETVYAHLSAARVEVGQQVGRGDRVGDMGNTGRSTGSHLHYEVRIDGEAVNPMKFVEAARDVL